MVNYHVLWIPRYNFLATNLRMFKSHHDLDVFSIGSLKFSTPTHLKISTVSFIYTIMFTVKNSKTYSRQWYVINIWKLSYFSRSFCVSSGASTHRVVSSKESFLHALTDDIQTRTTHTDYHYLHLKYLLGFLL